ncbi:MAG TPA: hypothetical protein VK399_08850 [Longimicrobiaceae bacterium]|nr:hypothetical protein [Longimicrobiaceae bacterium]
MQFFCRSATFGVALTAAAISLSACSDTSSPALPTESDAASASVAQGGPAYQRLARMVALSLREPSVRGMLQRSMAGSKVKEGKVHLNTYLRGEGALLLRAMSRAGGVSEAEVLAVLAETGSMEIYLPVGTHRSQWQGGSDLVVASLIDDQQVPFGVDLDGRTLTLSKDTPPTTPTISIVPAESFDAQGKPWDRDLATGPNASINAQGPRFNLNTTPFTGIWINEVHVGHDYEGWGQGNPEFEFYYENASTRQPIVCITEFRSVEPYHFNMDGTSYTGRPFLLAADNEVPEGVPTVISMWEDDTEPCVLKPAGKIDYVKRATDALNNAYSAYKGIKEKGWNDSQVIVLVYNTAIAFKAFFTEGDEFVGVSAGLDNIDGTARVFQLKNTNMTNTGWISLQWKTDVAH